MWHQAELNSYPNSYSSGGRTFVGFTGYQGKALYWREGYAEYGRQSQYALSLEPGSYKLSFSNAAWKGAPSYKAQILNLDGSVLAESGTYRATPNAEGSTTANLKTARTYELEFEVSQAGNYYIRFQNAGAMDGNFEEFLLLMCKVNTVKGPDASGIVDASREGLSVKAVYDIQGINTGTLRKGLNIVVMSDGSTRKVYVK